MQPRWVKVLIEKKVLFLVVALILSVLLIAGCSTPAASSAPAAASQAAPSQAASQAPASSAQAASQAPASSAAPQSNLQASLAIDVSGLKGSDGQPLVLISDPPPIPPKPTDADSLNMWNIEYSGRTTVKAPMIASPGDGAIGKKIIVIGQSVHPYWTAVFNGFKQVCDAYKMTYEIWNPNGDLNQQNQYVDKAIAAKPNLVMIASLDAKAAPTQFKKMYDAGIPVIAFNMIPTDEAMKYAIALTAPEDFSQFRALAKALADSMNGTAGVCYLTHIPGGSPYFARTINVQSYYKQNYPNMKTLDTQSPGFDAPKCKQVTADWITRFGKDLTAIVCSDDSAQALGAAQACQEAGRTDIKIIAAGNSKVGMDLVSSGQLFAITYQSAEADGSIPAKVAADYFNGKDLGPDAAFYLPQAVITKDNVSKYQPAQW